MTHAAKQRSLAARSTAVLAPIDRPQRPTEVTKPDLLRWRKAMLKSRSSWCPNETKSPPESPQPEKSRQKTLMPSGRSNGNNAKASNREELLPWR